VGSAIDALLVPELPTTLVWLGRVHTDDPVFLAIAAQARRVVLDTEYTTLNSLLDLARWSRAASGRPAIADLAWTRISPWQEMTARFFDEPRLHKHARRIRQLTIRQASDRGARLGSEASLLLGWMATRLGWRLQSAGRGAGNVGGARLARPEGEPIALVLSSVTRPQQVAPAALAGIAVEAEADGVVVRGTIDRELASGLAEAGSTPDADVLVWRLVVDVPSATEQHVRLGTNRGAQLLERTIHRPAHDPALSESARFAEEIENCEGLVCT
jgi:glucose-6-phosphate dehydrogenase assembly protein OpcA